MGLIYIHKSTLVIYDQSFERFRTLTAYKLINRHSKYELGCFPPRQQKCHKKFPKGCSVIHESLTLSLSVFLSGPSVHTCADSYGPLSSLSCQEISKESFTSSHVDLIKGQKPGSFCAYVCCLPVFAFVSRHT